MKKNQESRSWRRGRYQTDERREIKSRNKSRRHLRVGNEVPKKVDKKDYAGNKQKENKAQK